MQTLLQQFHRKSVSFASLMLFGSRVVGLLTLLVGVACAQSVAKGSVKLVVGFCPSAFSGKGAVVSVGPTSPPSFDVVGEFSYPDGIDEECLVLEDMTMTPSDQEKETFLSFSTHWGLLAAVNSSKGIMQHSAKGHSLDEYLFDGFSSMHTAENSKSMIGLTPHVTEDGFCSDGCFRFGKQDIQDGGFVGLQGDGPGGALPFKAVMSQACHYDEKKGIYYAQGSYGLNSKALCDRDETTECLYQINASDGKLLSSKKFPDGIVIYKYSSADSSDGTTLAWVYGFEDVCHNPYDSYAFVRLHLENGTVASKPVCIPKDVVVHEKPAMGAFSPDEKYFALSSGNSEGTPLQFLVFDTQTGKAVVDSDLAGLKKALKLSSIAPFVQIWGISWPS